jgi:hypothetical protein
VLERLRERGRFVSLPVLDHVRDGDPLERRYAIEGTRYVVGWLPERHRMWTTVSVWIGEEESYSLTRAIRERLTGWCVDRNSAHLVARLLREGVDSAVHPAEASRWRPA